ncbi:hypothetical protein LWC34_01220 [Kibdelosporangium philippinense]|uniref:DoxX-like family protein n=2 Tax=Kibdelosporangium philippinense TaxID=211113 RepID=A0ABS8Z6I2_9PSEU|nr:hypothetical protein [Kibdelosporangium philippinense]MCE7001467.1 hypothetical protein [Kibdelosporangium philippinense]
MKKKPMVWVLRTTAVLFLLAVLGQAVLAGQFVTGDTGFLEMHAVNGTVVGAAAIVWVIASLVLRVPLRMGLVGVAALLATGAQIGLGHGRDLGLHIPLGVALLGAGITLTSLSFAYRESK